MLDNSGFDLWSGDYDKSVGIADDNGLYPFAGYRELMNLIYGTVMAGGKSSILDVGIGTGTLASRLYDAGHAITGIDFSEKMLDLSRAKMPGATLIKHDFSNGLPDVLHGKKFDYVISTYAIHHLADGQKPPFIASLLEHLNDGGSVMIGDVAFADRDRLERCRADSGGEWDDDEYYPVFSELYDALSGVCELVFRQVSHCCGIIEVRRKSN